MSGGACPGGLSSRAGVIPFSSTLDTVGPMTRNVVDIAIVLVVWHGGGISGIFTGRRIVP